MARRQFGPISPLQYLPFAETFKAYNYDFYQVDPNLFSPAVVSFVNLATGQTTEFGSIETSILNRSFGLQTSGLQTASQSGSPEA